MADEVVIRGAQTSDAEQLLSLMRQLEMETTTIAVDEALPDLTITEEAEQIDLINESPYDQIIVAELEGDLIGIVTLQAVLDESETAELGVGVVKELWNQGLGTALVDEALYWAQTVSQLRRIILTVYAENVAAVHVYQKLGFQTVWVKQEKGQRLIEMKIEY
ncbi:acetyltransferase [Secundilactobacillus oryzae JCM 18671]|uniref:Acetyltransferase n=1 Tax=Secundilactobacillus oryzae JCM 18671 TaxID=1291743 RepID=A0A081BKC3_9LACO|nr:GNAT family N-acetyltransferase [Secundilactobacillus oryzae]GAK48491.1 acetyltransferase [Secundilactobacillus oryzae JCM 18671]